MRLLREHLDEIRVGLADNNGSMLSDDARFLTRYVDERWPCEFGVIETDIGDDCDRGIDNIVDVRRLSMLEHEHRRGN